MSIRMAQEKAKLGQSMAIRELRPAQVGGGGALGLLAATALRELTHGAPAATVLADICEGVDDASLLQLVAEASSRVPAAVWTGLAGFAGAFLGCLLAWRCHNCAQRRGGQPPRTSLQALRA